jgi:hypothetical protein
LKGFSFFSSSSVAIRSKTLAISCLVITKTVNRNRAVVDSEALGDSAHNYSSHPSTPLIEFVAVEN